MNMSLAHGMSVKDNASYVTDTKNAKSQSNLSLTNFTTIWSAGNRTVRAVASGVRSSDQLITLLHFDSSHFSLGAYMITFDVSQTSGTSIDNPISDSEENRIEIVTRDNDEIEESPDSSNKNRFQVKEGSNSITSVLFNDGTSTGEPSISLFFQRSAVFDVTISNITLKHYPNLIY